MTESKQKTDLITHSRPGPACSMCRTPFIDTRTAVTTALAGMFLTPIARIIHEYYGVVINSVKMHETLRGTHVVCLRCCMLDTNKGGCATCWANIRFAKAYKDASGWKFVTDDENNMLRAERDDLYTVFGRVKQDNGKEHMDKA